MAKTLHCTQMCYTRYFNEKYSTSGHLWQNRFFSSPLDTHHAYAVSKYIELNPVKAGLVQRPEDWPWSSARDHLNIEKGIITLSPINKLLKINNWQDYLKEGFSEKMENKIEAHSLAGKPLGNKQFVLTLERKLGIPLKKRPLGRPRIS